MDSPVPVMSQVSGLLSSCIELCYQIIDEARNLDSNTKTTKAVLDSVTKTKTLLGLLCSISPTIDDLDRWSRFVKNDSTELKYWMRMITVLKTCKSTLISLEHLIRDIGMRWSRISMLLFRTFKKETRSSVKKDELEVLGQEIQWFGDSLELCFLMLEMWNNFLVRPCNKATTSKAESIIRRCSEIQIQIHVAFSEPEGTWFPSRSRDVVAVLHDHADLMKELFRNAGAASFEQTSLGSSSGMETSASRISDTSPYCEGMQEAIIDTSDDSLYKRYQSMYQSACCYIERKQFDLARYFLLSALQEYNQYINNTSPEYGSRPVPQPTYQNPITTRKLLFLRFMKEARRAPVPYATAKYAVAIGILAEIVEESGSGNSEHNQYMATFFELAHQLALVLQRAGDLKSARAYAQSGVRGREILLGRTHPDFIASAKLLGEIYTVQGNDYKARYYEPFTNQGAFKDDSGFQIEEYRTRGPLRPSSQLSEETLVADSYESKLLSEKNSLLSCSSSLMITGPGGSTDEADGVLTNTEEELLPQWEALEMFCDYNEKILSLQNSGNEEDKLEAVETAQTFFRQAWEQTQTKATSNPWSYHFITPLVKSCACFDSILSGQHGLASMKCTVGYNTLHFFSEIGYVEAVSYIAFRIPKKSLDNWDSLITRKTALVYACENDHRLTVKVLINSGASFHSLIYKYSRSWFDQSAQIKTLLPFVSQQDLNTVWTNAFLASMDSTQKHYPHKANRRLLQNMMNDVDLDTQDENGKTILYAMCDRTIKYRKHRHEQVFKLLLKAGANPNATSGEGNTPLDAAYFYGNQELAKILLDHHAMLSPRMYKRIKDSLQERKFWTFSASDVLLETHPNGYPELFQDFLDISGLDITSSNYP